MHEKQEILDKLNAFLTYSISQDSQYSSQYTALIQPAISAVNAYFSGHHAQLEEKLKELVHNLYCDILERGTVMEFTYGDPLPTDFPEGYSDIRDCFYQFPLMTVTNEAFHAAWVMGVPEGAGSEEGGGATAEPEPISNSLITAWVAELTTAHQDDFDKVVALLTWVQNSCSTNDLVNLLEDTGRVVSQPSTQDVAEAIYVDKGLLEIINKLGLNVYVPSYLEG